MTQPDPALVGRQAAEAIVAQLELLKRELAGGADAPLERQLVAGEVAAEAMKAMLSDAFTRLTPPDAR